MASTFIFLIQFLMIFHTSQGTVIGKLSSIIQTNAGPIQGVKEIGFSGKAVDAYYGIPYAKPPIGQLRFAPPVKLPPWSHTLEAGQKPCSCYQNIDPEVEKVLIRYNVMVDRPWCEDCLKLNIWVPENIGTDPKSVLVKFHPGKFQFGSSTRFNIEGATFAAEEDMLVVTLNFRLNIFGFLALQSPDTPGNVGLLDQKLALEWVRENIASFGGNPNSVTLFGSASGATSIALHLMSPSSRGLYKRAVLIEQIPSQVKEQKDIIQKSFVYAGTVNCTQKDYESLVECLRSLSADELFSGYTSSTNQVLEFGPIIDGTFLPETPAQTLSSMSFSNVDIIVGTNGAEANPTAYLRNETDIKKILRSVIGRISATQFQLITEYYVNSNVAVDETQSTELINGAYSDVKYICGANLFAKQYSLSGNRVYRYVFSQPGLMTRGIENKLFGGFPLMSELPSAEALENMDPDSTSDLGLRLQAQLSRRMMKYLGNFAKTGDPNMDDKNETKWPRYTARTKKHLNLGFNISTGVAYRERECAFMNEIVLNLNKLRPTCYL